MRQRNVKFVTCCKKEHIVNKITLVAVPSLFSDSRLVYFKSDIPCPICNQKIYKWYMITKK